MMKTYHKRRLPHIQPVGATFFVTFNLEGAIPKTELERLKQERDQALWEIEHTRDLDANEQAQKAFMAKWLYFKRFDHWLDNPWHESPRWLGRPEVAKLVSDRLHEFNSIYYDLLAFCIMSNHVHVLFDFSVQLPKDGSMVDDKKYKQLWQVIKLIRGATATSANRILNRTGEPFWQEEYFDRYIRNPSHLGNAFRYTIMNPVKAGICNEWEHFPFTWAKPV